jgi:prepilin-type N-terminal cleavage/methylation domain-containing protein/prepilin-type processing-associated H-X9-DG protein
MLNGSNSKQVRRAFTLIELLVVIAIIGILAAILFPVFARARENSRRASCLSNEKQIALATLQYIQDNDERFPGTYTSDPQLTWMQRLLPYVQGGTSRKGQLFFCPSDHEVDSTLNVWTDNTSYCYNNFYLTGTTGAIGGGVHIASVTQAAQTVMYAETPGRSGSRYTCLPVNNLPTAPHFDGGNFAFVDGHAKWHRKPGPFYANQDFWKIAQ